MVTIYYANISEENHNDIMDKYLSFFSPEYQEKLSRYRRWQDTQLSLLGRVLLIHGLEHLNQKFDESAIRYNPYNKPYFDNQEVHFNISHSGDLVVCAITDLGEIGIDIEKIGSIELSNFKSMMTENEWNSVNDSLDSKGSFYRYWAQKEAVIKAHGKGLSIPLKTFEIRKNKTKIGPDNFYLQNISISDEYSCYIASREKLDSVNIIMDKFNITNHFN